MEYLPRIFKCMSFLPTFRFHPMGQQLQLTHLIFADDLMIFYKGEINTVTRVKETLEHQCKTRLVANVDKSKYRPSWYGDQMKEQLISLIGFTQVYFLQDTWAALDFKEVEQDGMSSFIDKITGESRLLMQGNYPMQEYYRCSQNCFSPFIAFQGSMFILPQRVVKDVDKKCRVYLWGTTSLQQTKRSQY